MFQTQSCVFPPSSSYQSAYLTLYSGSKSVTFPFPLTSVSGRTFKVTTNSVLKKKFGVRSSISLAEESSHQNEFSDVVIVGAGVSGLAAAVALNKIGIHCSVYEQQAAISQTGAALSLWGNGWKALDALSVSESLRSDYSLLTNIEITSSSGRRLKNFTIAECVNEKHEVRGVKRASLLNALADSLPPGTVQFGRKPSGFSKQENGITAVHFEDGTNVSTKVLLGCDGFRSSVARWLNQSPPSYCGYAALRGISTCEGGHSLGGTIRMVWGQGVRAGMYPLNDRQVYWFTCFNQLTDIGDRRFQPKELKQMALSSVEGWAFGVEDVINLTPESEISYSPICDRWPAPWTRWGQGGVTLLGDAAHPMTPNLGQGACTALEDAVVLVQKLGAVASRREKGWRELGSAEEIGKALEEYEKERVVRVSPLTIRSHVMGRLLQLPYAPVCFLRDNVALSIMKTDHFLDHALFDCGDLSAFI